MRFFYLRDEHGHPIGCVASELSGDTVKYAVSTCNPLDQFKRDQARELAAGRIAIGKCFTLAKDTFKGQVKVRILTLITLNPTYPQRAREAARLWLTQQEKKVREKAALAKVDEALKSVGVGMVVDLAALRDGPQNCKCNGTWHPLYSDACGQKPQEIRG